MYKYFSHIPVLLKESIDNLNIKKNGIYIDATFGCGGHSKLILSKLNNLGKLYAIDKDKDAINFGNTIKDNRFNIFHCNFSHLKKIIKKKKLIGKINGIIIDCGVSSTQIDNSKRGFSFIQNGPLDMRMNNTDGEPAYLWLSKYHYNDIYMILKKYGEERYAKKIARAIFFRNKRSIIKTTKELADLVSSVVQTKKRFKHPATRTFQAIRIHTNNELKEIKIILKDSLEILSSLGRLLVISFNSLEDRIVKEFMHKNSTNSIVPYDIPLTETELKKFNMKKLKIINRIFPSNKEILQNSRSRSAILRVAELL